MKNRTELAIANNRSSGLIQKRGGIYAAGRSLLNCKYPVNFVISGGCYQDKYAALEDYLSRYMCQVPIIIIHNNSPTMRSLVIDSWQQCRTDDKNPLWVIDQRSPQYEPFLGMNEMQVILTLKKLAAKMDYTVTAKFDRVTRAHITILKELNIPVCLSGFYYLASFTDSEEFYNNIMSLGCPLEKRRQIWADLDTASNDPNSQFDLFRAVIMSFAGEMMQSGWSDSNVIGQLNCTRAIEKNATLLLSVNDMYSNLLLTYLAEELKANAAHPFILLIDGIRIHDENLLNFLKTSSYCCFGIISDNFPSAIECNNEAFHRFCEKIQYFIFLKHSDAKNAEILSEIIGKFDFVKQERSEGYGRRLLDLLPQNYHHEKRTTTEQRYRVMPEQIIGLSSNQAVVFCATTDHIIFFN